MFASGLNRFRIGILWFVCVFIAIFSYRFLIGGVEATMDFVAYHATQRPIAFYIHIFLAPIALALVPFQLWRGLRAKRPAIHRMIGRCYGVLVVLSSASGLWMAINTQAGTVAAWGFGVLAVLWLAITAWGIALAMRGDLTAHRRWMLRSIALTMAGVMLRVYTPLSDALGLPFDAAYMAIAWLCWVPNLLVAELLIRLRPAHALETA